jgi:hypothetical protein
VRIFDNSKAKKLVQKGNKRDFYCTCDGSIGNASVARPDDGKTCASRTESVAGWTQMLAVQQTTAVSLRLGSVQAFDSAALGSLMNIRFVFSHPFARKKAKGWGTELLRGFWHAVPLRMTALNLPAGCLWPTFVNRFLQD